MILVHGIKIDFKILMCGAPSPIGNLAPTLSHLKMLDQRAAGLWSRLADSGLLAGLA